MTTRNRELASIIDASGNITTGGNLSVAGNLTQTNSTTTSYSDGLLELNSGAGSNSNDLGLVMERGSTGDNAIFLWDESNDGFAVGTTTAVGTATGNISFSAAPFTASTVTGTILTGSTSVKTPLIEYTDGDDAITIADGGHITTGANLSIGGSNNELRFYEGSNYVGFEAPALSADQIWVLPTADGSSGQILKTDGSGNLSFTDDLTLANASVNNFSGNGSTTGFTLSTTPVSENATQVYINGVYQFKNTYSVSGTTLTFDAAPPNGSSIEALVWSTVAINTPADASVTNSSLNASVITGQSEVTAAGADHVLIYDASATALKKALVSDFGNTDEEIQDIVGAMFSSNTETGIGVTYQDGDGTLDLVIGDDSIVSSMLDTNIDIAGTLDVTGVLTTDTNATIAGTLGIAGGSSNGVQISQGAIAIKNGGSKSYIDLYCESSNAHYTRIEDAAHSAYSGNVTVTLPVATGTLALTSGSVATVTGAAQSAITSLGTLTTLTVDEMTLNADTLTASDDFIIDAVGDITLDAADNQIFFKDNGTTVGTLSMTDSDLKFISNVNDKDMIFAGTDNNSEITALTLDMSAAGKATFNDAVIADSFETTAGGTFTTASGNDLNIVYPDTRSLFIKEAGTTHVTVDNTGQVGIGETSPLAKLHIKRGDSGLSSLNAAGDHIFLENTGSNGTGITLASGNTANGSIIFGDQDSNYRGVLIYDHSADAMKFVTAASERMRIHSSGHVSIKGTANASADGLSNLTLGNGSGDAGLSIYSATNGNSRIMFADGTSGGAQYDGFITYTHSSQTMSLGTAGSGAADITIDSAGRVGIGGASPPSGTMLDVQGGYIRSGNVYMGTGGSGTKFEGGNGSYEPSTGNLLCGGTGLDLNFLVVVTGVGVTTSAKVDSPTGDFFTNDGSISSLSDERVKSDITTLSDGLDIVKQLRPVTFKYNDTSEDADGNKRLGSSVDKVRYGFIAQEVEEVAPQYVETGIGYINNEEVDDFKSMSTTRMIPMLFKAIQEQQAIIDDLKSRIETLEG